jgi:hypothetical protein
MISLPKKHQDALRAMVHDAAGRGIQTSVSGLIRELVEARMAAGPALTSVPALPDTWPADLWPPEPLPPAEPQVSAADQMRQLLAASPPKPPSQMSREEREEHMRRMDPEGYRKMREAYEVSLSATGDD